MFIPIVAAWVLFQGLDQKATKAIRRVEKANIRTSRATAADSLTGFEGKGTFYRHLARIEFDRKEYRYTRAYYYLDHWRRDETDIFWIDKLLVVLNPKPHSLAEFTGLLKISNAEASATRRRRLEEARRNHNSLTAGKAKASGGKNVADSNKFDLTKGVEAIIPNKDLKLEPYVINSTDARLGLDDGELVSLEMPNSFSIKTPTYMITGIGMEGRANESQLVIKKNPRIANHETAKTKPLPGRVLRGRGPLIWLPDDVVPGEVRAVLSRARFDFGHLKIFGDVRIELPDITISADELKARVGHEDGKSDAGKLNNFKLKGSVVVTTPRGVIRGDEGRVTLDRDGGAIIWVEGKVVDVKWQSLVHSSSEESKQTLHARSLGRLRVKVPRQEDRRTQPLEIDMVDTVVVDIKDVKNPLHLKGESLLVSLSHVELPSAEESESKFAWRLRQAVMRGHVEGDGRDFQIKTTKLTVNREYEEGGALKTATLNLDGPAELQRSGGLGRNISNKNIRTTLKAKRRITYWMPASPFAEASARAEGHVEAFETGAPDKNRTLGAEWLHIVLMPADGNKDRTKTLEAKGSVDCLDEKGSHIVADRVWIDREAGFALVEGEPARLTFVDKKNQKQKLRAPRIELHANGSKLIATGGFDGALTLRGAVLSSDHIEGKETAKAKSLWTVSGTRMWAIFGGRLPLSTKPDTNSEPIRLLDIDMSDHVRIESTEQIMTGEHIHYDFRTEIGSTRGNPARLVSFRTIDGVRLKDWIESEKILTQPAWTLFEGRSVAHLNIKREKASRRDPSNWEILRVECTDEIIIRKDLAIFSGACILERGVVAIGGLRLESDKIIARFAPSLGKTPRPQELEKIEAIGHVQLARESLRGQGEFLDFDYGTKKAVLTARDKPSRMWTDGFQIEGAVVEYDLNKKQMKVIKPFARPIPKERKN